MLRHDSPVPLYVQLANLLRDGITTGTLTGRIPSIKGLSQEHEVSTRTVERALEILKDEGVVVAVVGKGFYVAED